MRQDTDSRAQARENEDPEEAVRPIPVSAALVAIAMVVFGLVYIPLSGPLGDTSLGDRRTRADLAGPAGGASAAVDGKAIFAAQCAACHQASGKGLPGVFPPLDGSEWVQGAPKVVANILLHGITGQITVAGNKFEGAMPSFAQLSDAELAGVASFVRSNWSNKAEPIGADLFAQERKASAGRSTPFEGEAALKAIAP
jgi:mono/diheme cytochrome c family protein